MAFIGMGLFYLGWLVAVVGGIMFLIAAFSESLLWGLACLLLPIVSLVFLVQHWAEAKKSFFIQLGGMALIFVGAMVMAFAKSH